MTPTQPKYLTPIQMRLLDTAFVVIKEAIIRTDNDLGPESRPPIFEAIETVAGALNSTMGTDECPCGIDHSKEENEEEIPKLVALKLTGNA